jgi:hypothetical protein
MRTRRRAVIFDPQGRDGDRWIRTCATFAHERGYDVTCVVRRLEDALYELANGRADVLIVMAGNQLRPLIEIVTDAGPAAVSDGQRRTRRL